MKNLIIVAMLLLCMAGCTDTARKWNEEEASVSTWVWSNDKAVSVRIGSYVTENNEAGISCMWWPDESEPRVLGVYGLHHFPELAEFRNPFILDFLPETFVGRPYIGAKLDVNRDLDDTAVGPVAGIVFEDIIFLEYQYQTFEQNSSSADSTIRFGLRIRF